MPRDWPTCDWCGAKLPRHPTAASWEIVSECQNDRCPKRQREKRLLRHNRLIFVMSMAMVALQIFLVHFVGGPLSWLNTATAGFVVGITFGAFALGNLYLFD